MFNSVRECYPKEHICVSFQDTNTVCICLTVVLPRALSSLPVIFPPLSSSGSYVGKKKKEEAEGIQIFVQCQSQDSFMVTVVLVLSKFIRHVTLSANVCV